MENTQLVDIETKQQEIISSLNPIDNLTLELLINKKQMKTLFKSNYISNVAQNNDIRTYKSRILNVYEEYLNATDINNTEIQSIMDNLTQKIINHLKRMDEMGEPDNDDDGEELFGNMENNHSNRSNNTISFWGKKVNKMD